MAWRRLFFQGKEYRVQYALKVRPNVFVAKAQHAEAVAPKLAVSCGIVGEVPVMGFAVEFDDELSLYAGEVRIELADRALTAEFVAAEPAITQLRPHEGFGLGCGLAKFARALRAFLHGARVA